MRKAATVELDMTTRKELERLSRSRSVSVRLAERSRIVLLAARGLNNQEIGVHAKRQTIDAVDPRMRHDSLVSSTDRFTIPDTDGGLVTGHTDEAGPLGATGGTRGH